MPVHGWVSIVACAGHLALAILVFLHRTGSPLRLPMALLALDLFTWNLAALAYSVSGNVAWHWLDRAVSPFSAPLALHVVAIFVGRGRALRHAIALGYVGFAALVFWISSPMWERFFVGGVIISMTFASGLLINHLWLTTDPEEGIRTRLILTAMGIGTTLGSIDLWYEGIPALVKLPPLSNIATLVSTGVLAMVALRFRLLERQLPVNLALRAVAFSVLGLVGYIAVFHWLETPTAVVVLGLTTVVIVLLATAREIRFASAMQRERTQQLATMGRFSQQLAHDLKNPLTALDGSLQFLKKEHQRGHSLTEHHEFIDLMADQVARLRRTVDDYQRIARVEPIRMPVALNDLVCSVLALQPFAAAGAVTVKRELGDALPECQLDHDLLARALENLVRNAIEAMPTGGAVTVRTGSAAGKVVLSVEDEGVGMDARHIEHAFDDFYTTKAGGTGLGLAFVRRVAEAHGGRVSMTSELGKGTVVCLEVPCELTEHVHHQVDGLRTAR